MYKKLRFEFSIEINQCLATKKGLNIAINNGYITTLDDGVMKDIKMQRLEKKNQNPNL
jgi:hypothetical protein